MVVLIFMRKLQKCHTGKVSYPRIWFKFIGITTYIIFPVVKKGLLGEYILFHHQTSTCIENVDLLPGTTSRNCGRGLPGGSRQ